MGYTTDFMGAFDVNNKMTREFVEYINRFSSTRRMTRNVEKIKKVYTDWEKLCFMGNLGIDGEYLAIESKMFGQDREESIIDYNKPPVTQPALWCQWIIETNEDLKDEEISEFTGKLAWDGGEKFYEYVNWLKYMIKNFFIPANLELNGAVLAVGECSDDATYIIINKNDVRTYDALEKNAVEQIKTYYNDNKTVLEYMQEVEKTPEEIHDEFWYWEDEDEDW